MKAIVISVVAVATVLIIMFVDFTPTGNKLVQPEGARTEYSRPVKDGNCFIQKDSLGNEIKVCG